MDKQKLNLIVLITVAILTTITPFVDWETQGFIHNIWKFNFYILLILLILSYLSNIRFIPIIVAPFLFFSLFPIFNLGGDTSDFLLLDRARWLFYSVIIISADLRNIRIWIDIVLGMILLNLILCTFFPQLFYPTDDSLIFLIQKFPNSLLLGGLFLFCIYECLSQKQIYFLYFTVIVTLIIYLFYGRRTPSIQLFFFLLAPLFVSNRSILKRIWVSIALCSIGYLTFDFFFSVYSDDFFSNLSERAFEDTRSFVDQLVFLRLETIYDWLFGIGVQGGYPNPIDHEKSFIRTYVETGVLDVIMDGGVFLWLSMMLASIRAFYLGYFKSNNLLIKGFSYVLLFFILMQYPIPQADMDMYGLCIFTSIGICLNTQYREMTDDEIKAAYFKKNDYD